MRAAASIPVSSARCTRPLPATASPATNTPAASAACSAAASARRSLALLREEMEAGAVVVPAHDPGSAERLTAFGADA